MQCTIPNFASGMHTIYVLGFSHTSCLSLQDVVLLITAQWCGFCSSFSHTYLQLSKYFASAQDLLFAKYEFIFHLSWTLKFELLHFWISYLYCTCTSKVKRTLAEKMYFILLSFSIAISLPRIDADKNDLHWEFTLDSYPTILFFPAHR